MVAVLYPSGHLQLNAATHAPPAHASDEVAVSRSHTHCFRWPSAWALEREEGAPRPASGACRVERGARGCKCSSSGTLAEEGLQLANAMLRVREQVRLDLLPRLHFFPQFEELLR